jgi:single-stranded DNA-binding protein
VAGDVLFNPTRKGDRAASFRIAIEQPHKTVVFVRINVYGGNVDAIRERGLKKGDYVVVDGELMNRRGPSDTLTEVRCSNVVILRNAGKEEEHVDRQEEPEEE